MCREPPERNEVEQKMRDTPKRATCLYLQLAFGFSAVVWTLIIWSGHLYMAFGLMVPAIMWCPALAVLVTCRLLGRDFGSLAWRWPNHGYIVAASCACLHVSCIWCRVAFRLGGWNSEFVNQVAQGFGLRGLPAWGSLALYIISMATGGVVLNLWTGGGGIGWRVFLVPELAKQMSFTKVV